MSTTDVATHRLTNQRLAGNPLSAPVEVVRWLGTVQAQDYGPAKWSLGERSRGTVDADIDRAMAEGAILRTHMLRPTWHFVLPQDIRWMQALTAPRVHAQNAYYYRQTGVRQRLTSRISAFDRPRYFQDVMVRGAFAWMEHDHWFDAAPDGGTVLRDAMRFAAPLGILGRVAERLVLRRYMTRFLLRRNAVIKRVAESDAWREYLPDGAA